MKPFPVYKGDKVVEEEADQTTLTQRFTNEAVSFVGRNKDKPFFLYYAHTMPHVPLYTSKEYRGSSRAGLYGDVVQFIDGEVGRLMAAAIKRPTSPSINCTTSPYRPALEDPRYSLLVYKGTWGIVWA